MTGRRFQMRRSGSFARSPPPRRAEGIVSKRKDSPYRSVRSPDWLKMKNPASAAVRREAEEDLGQVAVPI